MLYKYSLIPFSARDVKHREIFEKTFVELKKQREEKDRSSRLDRSRTANEKLIENADNLQVLCF